MADIVLKDRNGSPVEYPGVERIKVNTVDGEAVEFVDSAVIPEVVENLPIALDFSGGNQEIIAPDGVVVKSAVIQQPASLIPENIAEGVNIAGIIGALAAGGNLKGKCGYDTQKSTIRTINHNLGVVPDFVLVLQGQSGGTASTSLKYAVAMNQKFADLVGRASSFQMYCSGGELASFTSSVSYTDQTSTSGEILKTTEASFEVGRKIPLYAGTQYFWLVIGGLT